MAMLRYAPPRRHQTDEESSRPSAITGSHIMAVAWRVVDNAAAMVAVFFR